MSQTISCEKWVLITDTSDLASKDLSDRQLSILSEKGCDRIQTIDCSSENAPDKVCGRNGVPAFPTMCNLDSQKCVSGLNETDAHFASVLTAS